MIRYHNPVFLLRKIVHTVKGVECAESWAVYVAVTAFSVAASLLFVLHAAWLQSEANVRPVSGQPHIVLPVRRMPLPALQAAAALESKAAEKSAQTAPAKKVRGEWYYNEVYKEWRFKKIEES